MFSRRIYLISRRNRRICRTCRTMITHAEIAEYAETYRTKIRRFALPIVLRILRAIKSVASRFIRFCDFCVPKNYSTTTFRVAPPNFTKYIPRGNSMVALPSISFVRMVCPRAFVMIALPVPSIVTRSLAGLG